MNLEVHIPHLIVPKPFSGLISTPHVPHLEKLLARADRTVIERPEGFEAVSEQWGLKPPYAMAPVAAQQDGLPAHEQAWLFAEPVNLSLQRDWLKLAPARMLDITANEAVTLIEALNHHFREDGLTFFSGTADRWYVQCDPSEIPTTTPTERTKFDPASKNCQPQSHGNIQWHAIQNEAQMLLHSHAVNAAREAAGKPVINGVWFWGGGTLPMLAKPPFDAVIANNPLVHHFAKQTDIGALPFALESLQQLLGNGLLVIEDAATMIEELDRTWFQTIAQFLRAGTISRLHIVTSSAGVEQQFALSPRNFFWRRWRQTKPLSSYA